jgi:PAS domain S-box-containing protein
MEMNESFLKTITRAIPGMIVAYNVQNGKYIFVNEAVKKILGYSPKHLLEGGLPFVASLIHPEDIQLIVKKNSEALKKANSKKYGHLIDKTILDFEYRMRHKNGSWRWLHTSGTVLSRDSIGNVENVLNISIDITDRKNAEEIVKKLNNELETRVNNRTEQLQFLATLTESIPDAVIGTDLNNKNISWNKGAERMYGYKADEVSGKVTQKLLKTQFKTKEGMKKRDQALKERGYWRGEVIQTRKDGSLINVLASSAIVKNISGIPMGRVGVNRNITKRKQHEDDLRRSEEYYRTAIDAGKVGTWEWDIQQNEIIWSERTYQFHGINPGEFSGKFNDFIKLIHPDDAQKLKNAIQNTLEKNTSFELEFRAIRPSGEVRWLQTRGRAICDDNGKPIRMVGATVDTTERKILERQKDDFLSMASHELKTPLTSLKVFTQLMQNGLKDYPDLNIRRFISRMGEQIDKLTFLVNDLLDVSRIQGGRLEFKKEWFLVRDLIKDTVEDIQPTAPNHLIFIKNHSRTKIFADRERIGQVLVNLLTNAVKYSPKAKNVEVNAKRTSKFIEISVRDYGIGISKEHQEKIFGRFYRIGDADLSVYGGLGMGLYISAEIIERHGGKIWVESKKGKGSTFKFTIPIK